MSGTGSFSTLSYPRGGAIKGIICQLTLDDGDVQRYLLVNGLTEDHTSIKRNVTRQHSTRPDLSKHLRSIKISS
jgi:hypothetical protein